MKVLHPHSGSAPGCGQCRTDELFPFTMAFQPIVYATGVFAYEALVRGPAGEGAGTILAQVSQDNMYAFDQACRVKAIEMAAALGACQNSVSINFIPGAVYQPEACIRKTLETATRVGLPLTRIIFEVTEGEQVKDRAHLVAIFREYRKHGLKTAIDDFGAGYAGLDLLAEFQPDIVKLDMKIVRDLDKRPASRTITRAVAAMCRDLGIRLIAEGIETRDEFAALADLGVELFQGYLFGKPKLGAMDAPLWPAQATPPHARPGLATLSALV